MAEPESLEERVAYLERENAALRDELLRIQNRAEAGRKRRGALLRGTSRVLLPLFDRQRVVRSFARLAETTSRLAGPEEVRPSREMIATDARSFLESCVRFVIRRRLFLVFFALLGASVPMVQLWLVMQQNRIIENQTEFFRIQVYDIVARSMTEGDRNARKITGALLANAKLEFLAGVVEEAFDRSDAVYTADDVHRVDRRLEDAGFRGHLIRAVTRGVVLRARDGHAPEQTLALARPLFRMILTDTQARLPSVLRIGRASDIPGALGEEVDYYIAQVGRMLRTYGQLARATDEQGTFFRDLARLITRLSRSDVRDGNRFYSAYRVSMQDFLFDLALRNDIGKTIDLRAAGTTPEAALQTGLERLQSGIDNDDISWEDFSQPLN